MLLLATLFAVLGSAQTGDKPDKKIEVQLLWGTDSPTSPNPDHKPVEPDIKRKLKELPLRWTNYFMVKKLMLSVPRGGAKGRGAPCSMRRWPAAKPACNAR